MSGRVVTGSPYRAVAGVEVLLPHAQKSARTDSLGTFHIRGLSAGRHPVLVRLPGYGAVSDTVSIVDGQEHRRDYLLARSTLTLDSVLITALGGSITPHMRTFERRRSAGLGSFVSPEELRQKEDVTLRFVLARIPGIRFVTYKSASFAASARGAASNRNESHAVPGDRNSPRRCWVQIYLDAIRIYSPIASGGGQPVPNIEDYRVRDLEAVEFYPGPAATPAELGGTGATCGTLVLWTREK